MVPTRRRVRRGPRRSEAQRSYETLTIEGGLLAPEWLDKVASLDAPGQSEADYRVPRGLSLRDEIGRYWRVAQAHFGDFTAGRAARAEPRALAERCVVALLREAFCFQSLVVVDPVVLGDRTYPVGHAALAGSVPIVVAPASLGLETASPLFADGARRRSAFGLAQEYLNAADGALWGIACDGLTLRILRDNASLTRPAWIEANLYRIFTEERYADFAALWLLLHETRFGAPDRPVTGCLLETWRDAGRAAGTRAREHLRRGVEDALLELGHGFLSHKDNGALRAALADGTLQEKDYFNQLQRLVYRLIFLLTIEERGLLHPDGTPSAVRELYAEGYGLRRLRERAAKRSAYDRHEDLWAAARIVLRGVASGEPRLGLPTLGGLFGRGQCAALDAAKLENRSLLTAMFKLSWLQDAGGLSRVNWRDMGPEELGSVYESLLELVPVLSIHARSFAFATGDETKGNARKTTGSYYTPDSLVQVLLDSALEPVIKERLTAQPDRPVAALLSLSIVDPACGSGHFLLAAARRLAGHVARQKSSGTPSAKEYRSALRQVVGRCIYGVDLNPMAVELCKVALWMEAVEPGLPLTFLDAHIQCGNALLGTTPELMKGGIPDAAWEPIEGDDRKIASSLKKRNGKEALGQKTLSLWSEPTPEPQAVTRAVAELEAASDEDPEALAAKESRWAAILASGPFQHQRFVADAWCAAFVWPKPDSLDPVVEAAPTLGLWQDIRDGKGQPPVLTVKTVEALAAQYHFFHWHLAFPTVFERGGFDVVLGNPPWERVKLQEQEFFASRSVEIAKAVNAAARKKLIAALPKTDPILWNSWCAASREAEGQSHLIRDSGRYPLCGKGDVNTYALFAEHNRAVLESKGRAGFITPPGLATDDTTKAYFQTLTAQSALVSLYEFENEEFLFLGIDHRVRFIVITVSGQAGVRGAADLAFGNRQVSALANRDRHFSLSPADFAVLNPNTRTCPTFRSRRDADINLAIYRRAGVLWQEDGEDCNPWGLRFMRMLDMANDSGRFRSRATMEGNGHRLTGNCFEGPEGTFLPLIEAKMVHHFDHRFGTYEGQTQAGANQGKLPELDAVAHADPDRHALPDYWVAETEVMKRLVERWERGWLLGWRDICRSTDQRTVIASLIPTAAVGDKFLLMMPSIDPRLTAVLYANLCSFALDYCARQKVGGTSLKYFTMRQFPVLAPAAYAGTAPWSPGATLRDFLLPLVLELTYTAWDLAPFAKDVGYDGPPFLWDPARRFLLRAELDAAFFHLYGLSRDDTAYILDTFPIVKKNEEKVHGEYRTRRVILEIYDAMAEAARTGGSYATRLDPPPADPRVAHTPRQPAPDLSQAAAR